MGGQLEPLPLAAGQRGERLVEPQVAEPHVGHALQDRMRGRRTRLAFAEEADRVVDRQVEDLGDRRPAEPVVEHRRLEPPYSRSSQTVATPAIIARSV